MPPVAHLLVELGTSSAKSVREAVLPLLAGCRDQARSLIDRVLAESDAGRRNEAVLLLWRLFGRDAAEPSRKHAAHESSDRVRQTIENLLAAPADLPADDAELTASLPPVQIEPGEVALPEEAKAALREFYDRAWKEAMQHYERFREQWNSPQRPRHWTNAPVKPEPVSAKSLETLCRFVEGKAPDLGGQESDLSRFYNYNKPPFGARMSPSGVRLVHIVRISCALNFLQVNVRNTEGLWWYNTNDLEAHRGRCEEPFGLRELDAALATLPGCKPGLIAKAYLESNSHYRSLFDWEPPAVWPLFADRLDMLREALGPAPTRTDNSWNARRLCTFKVVAMFPKLPPGFIPLLWDLALSEGKTERPLAQAALATVPDKPAKIKVALRDGRQTVRAAAAEWLGKIGDPSAVAPLKDAFRQEKQEVVKGVLMAALEALGADVNEFLDRDALLKEAEAGLAKKRPKGMEWFSLAALPQLFQKYSTDCMGSAIAGKGMLALVAAAGGGDCVKLCEQYIRKWFGNRLSQCKCLVRVLGWMRHPLEIQVLLSLSNRFRTKAVRQAAGDHVAALAEPEGWTIDELSDRTIPDGGFERPVDESGAPVGTGAVLVLDYRPRKFKVTLDDDLQPVITTEDGKTVKNPPAAGKPDDADKAKAARKAFADGKKMVKEVVKRQAERFYEALCTQRSWRFEDWRRFRADHPIVGRLCVRVAWAAVGPDEKFLGCFRPLEDGSLTNEKDEEVTLDADLFHRGLRRVVDHPAAVAQAAVVGAAAGVLYGEGQIPEEELVRLARDYLGSTAADARRGIGVLRGLHAGDAAVRRPGERRLASPRQGLASPRSPGGNNPGERLMSGQAKREGLARWRLVLGKYAQPRTGDCLSAEQQRMADALEQLYAREYKGRGVRQDPHLGPGSLDPSQLNVPKWLDEVRELFPKETCTRITQHALDRIVVLRPAHWGERFFDELQQRSCWPLLDETGGVVSLTLPWTPVNEDAIEFLEAVNPSRDRLTAVVARLLFGNRGVLLEPLSLLSEGTPGGHRVLNPAFDRGLIVSRQSDLLARLRQKYGRDRVATAMTADDEADLDGPDSALAQGVPAGVRARLNDAERGLLQLAEGGLRRLNEPVREGLRRLTSELHRTGLREIGRGVAELRQTGAAASVL